MPALELAEIFSVKEVALKILYVKTNTRIEMNAIALRRDDAMLFLSNADANWVVRASSSVLDKFVVSTGYLA